MTTPVGSTTGSLPVPPPPPSGGDGLDAGGAGAAGLGPATLFEGARSAGPAAGDLALLVLTLETERSKVDSRCRASEARSHAEVQREAVAKRLEGLAQAAQDRAKAAKWGDLATVLKWVGAVAAAVAGVAGAVFSGGSSVAVAAVVITAIFAAESCAKALGEALVSCGVDPKIASGIAAGLGSMEDLVASLAGAGAFGDKGESVVKAFGAVTGLAKAVVSTVCSGGAGAASIAAAVCSITAATVRLARTGYEVAAAELAKDGEAPDWKVGLGLEVTGLVLDLASLCSGLGGGSRGRGEAATAARGNACRAAEVTAGTASLVGAGAGAGAAGSSYGAARADASALEASGRAEAEAARAEAALASLERARRELDRVLEELESVRDEAELMLESDPRDGAWPAARA